jgi:hypothetical protein
MKQFYPLLFSIFLWSCGYNNTEIPGADGGTRGGQEGSSGLSPIDYTTVKSQILDPQCLRCHSNAGGNRGGVNLETFANVKAYLNRIQQAVTSGFMPPTGPLSASQKNIINQWISSGAPERIEGSNPGTPSAPGPTPPPLPECPEDRPAIYPIYSVPENEVWPSHETNSQFQPRRRGACD